MDLTDAQRKDLKNVVKEGNVSATRQALALLALDLGADASVIARVFAKNNVWLTNAVNRFGQGVEKLSSGKTSPGRPPRFTAEQREKVCAIRQAHPDWTLAAVQEEIQKKMKVTMSIPTVRAIILNAGFTFSSKDDKKQRCWGQQ